MAEENGRAREIAAEVRGELHGLVRELEQGRDDRDRIRRELMVALEKSKDEAQLLEKRVDALERLVYAGHAIIVTIGAALSVYKALP